MENATEKENTNTPTLYADTNISMKSGRLVRDAELISNEKFVKISIATNKQYLDKNDEIQTTVNYFNALVSSNLTEAFEKAKDLKKGDWVYLKGEDSTQSFDTVEGYKKNDITLFAYKVTVKGDKGKETPTPST